MVVNSYQYYIDCMNGAGAPTANIYDQASRVVIGETHTTLNADHITARGH